MPKRPPVDLPPVIFLLGPTASGKTQLAIELAERFGLEIVSVDSALVYRGMDIGTAKPGAEELSQAPHRLIDICDPAEAYSAGRFLRDAHREIDAVHAAGKLPLLVGGTMLYFRALEQGLAQLPPANAELRARIDAEGMADGWPALHLRLAGFDPESAARIAPRDSQRIQRALEVYELTGRPLSAWRAEQAATGLANPLLKLALDGGDRRTLHLRIEKRFKLMIEKGFVAEVEGLFRRGDLRPEMPSMRAVGYRQLWQHVSGEVDLEAACERAVVATRQLAKRQLTWLRSMRELEIVAPETHSGRSRADALVARLKST